MVDKDALSSMVEMSSWTRFLAVEMGITIDEAIGSQTTCDA